MSSIKESSGCSTLEKTDERSSYSQLWVLEQNEELRIQVSKDDSVDVILTLGDAELTGVELVPNVCYNFGPGKYACLHSWTGATLKISIKSIATGESLGSDDTLVYKSEESMALAHLNVHHFLKQLRDSTEDGNTGPRVMVCGPTDSGKSTLCKILLNYAIRNGNNCIYVDLDVGQNSLTIPGTLSASYINKPIHSLSEGKVTTPQSYCNNEDFSESNCPLVYFVGDPSVGHCAEACSFYIDQMGKILEDKFDENKKIAKSGCIINTAGFITGKGKKVIMDTIKSFDVNVIIVLHDENLYNVLKKKLDVSSHIVLLPKTTAVKVRSKKDRRMIRQQNINTYFSGLHCSFAPTYFKEMFDELNIYVPTQMHFSQACMPIGVTANSSLSIKMRKVAITPSMKNCILAVLMCDEEDKAVTAAISGFVVIVKINMEKKKIRLMSPCSEALSFKFFSWSEKIKYTEGIDYV